MSPGRLDYFSLLSIEVISNIFSYCLDAREALRLTCHAFRGILDVHHKPANSILLNLHSLQDFTTFNALADRMEGHIPALCLRIVASLPILDAPFTFRERERFWTLMFALERLPFLHVDSCTLEISTFETCDLHSISLTLSPLFRKSSPLLDNLRELRGVLLELTDLPTLLGNCPLLEELSLTIRDDYIDPEDDVEISSTTLRYLWIDDEQIDGEEDLKPHFSINLPAAEAIFIYLTDTRYQPVLTAINAPKLHTLTCSFLLPMPAYANVPSLRELAIYQPRVPRLGYLPPSLKVFRWPPMINLQQMDHVTFSPDLLIDLTERTFVISSRASHWFTFFHHHGARRLKYQANISTIRKMDKKIQSNKWPGLYVECVTAPERPLTNQ
jgi:hypothetical protein